MCTQKKYSDYIKSAMEIKKQTPLSQAAMEALTVVAYNQPVTKSFVESVRGIDSSSVINTLVEKGLLEEDGRLDVPGKPVAYRTKMCIRDRPTAALDALAEYSLYKNFDEIIGDKSAIYISHRLSSTRFCDSIAMFKAGEMVEYGTHEELLAKGGAYSEMFNIQAQYYKEGEKEYEEIG